MPANGERQCIFKKKAHPAAAFALVFVNAQVLFGGFGIEVLGNDAVRVKCFAVAQIFHQLNKVVRCFVGMLRFVGGYFLPAFFIAFYK